MGEDGNLLAEWDHEVGPAGGTIVIDSQDVRQRFGLGDFCGSLFLHAVGAPFHEIVKYALDVYGDAAEQMTCTHDANAWPAEFYAGVPAPNQTATCSVGAEQPSDPPFPRMPSVSIWSVVRTSVPSLMKSPPFGTRMIDVGEMLPDASFPDQIEIPRR